MRKITRVEKSPEKSEKMKNEWFTFEEANENFAIHGAKMSKTSFDTEAKKIDCDKNFGELGKPEIKTSKSGGRGRPRNIYNRAFIEAMRTLAISDTYIKVEEGPIDFFLSDDWKELIQEEFRETLNLYLSDEKNVDVYGIVEELTISVSENIIKKYAPLIGQNKLLIHQNKKLEDTKEYFIAVNQRVEGSANVVNDLAQYVKDDASESSKLLNNQNAAHLKTNLSVNRKLNEIQKTLEDIKNNSK